ncbi:hypothetical protein EV175_000138 [Coemansia sp. RSA 1933]|nr:hypothetical protein EV175_000138 [Coemansia sp. RSA 1933]
MAALVAAAPYSVPSTTTTEANALPAPKIANIPELAENHQRRQMTRLEQAVPPMPVVRELATFEQTATAHHIYARAASSSVSVGNAADIMTAIAAKDAVDDANETSTTTITITASAPSVGNADHIMAAIAVSHSESALSTSTVTVTVVANVPDVADESSIMNLIDVGDYNSSPSSMTLQNSDGESVGVNGKANTGVPCSFYDQLAELSITMSSNGCIPDSGDDSESDDGNSTAPPMFEISPTSGEAELDASSDSGNGAADEDAAKAAADQTSVTDTSDSSANKCVVLTTTVYPTS